MRKLFLALFLLFPLQLPAETYKTSSDAIFSLAPFSGGYLLDKQTSRLPAHTRVSPIAWSEDRQMLKVDLQDGSRGYIPAFSLLQNKLQVYVKAGEWGVVPFDGSYDYRKNDLHSRKKIPEGTYVIEDVAYWEIFNEEGLVALKLLIRSVKNGGRYITGGETSDGVHHIQLDCTDAVPAAVKGLPVEEALRERALIKKPAPDKWVGSHREDIEAEIGEANTWLSPARMGSGETLAYYPLLALQDRNDRSRLGLGVEIQYSDKGIASAWNPCPCLTMDKGGIDIPDLFARNPLLRLLQVILLIAFIYFIEWLRIRLNLKFGSNKLAGIFSYVVPALAIMSLSSLYEPGSSFWGLVYLLVIVFLIAAGGQTMRGIIRRHRCEQCHRYSPEEEQIDVKKSPIYIMDSVVKKQTIEKKYADHEEIDRDDPILRILYHDIMNCYNYKWVTAERRKVTTTKRCPRCKYEWKNFDTETVNSYETRHYDGVEELLSRKMISRFTFVEDEKGRRLRIEQTKDKNIFRDIYNGEWIRTDPGTFKKRG